MRLAVLSLCLFVGCFQEPPADRVWRCTADKPQCPEGQSCINDWCIKDGTAQPDLLMSSDGSADMSKLPCSDGFPIGTQGVWACRGKFGSGGSVASSLCTNGYKVCVDGNRLTDAECSNATIKGFFFADLTGQGTSLSLFRCAMGGTGTGAAWFGCGSIVGTNTPTERTASPCKNIPLVSACDTVGFICNKSDLRLSAQRNDSIQNGVLCCPP